MDRNKKYIILNYASNILEVISCNNDGTKVSFKDIRYKAKDRNLFHPNNVTCILDNTDLTDDEFNHFKRLVKAPAHILEEEFRISPDGIKDELKLFLTILDNQNKIYWKNGYNFNKDIYGKAE